MIIDQRYRNRYLFAGLSPRQPFPGRWYKFGTIKKAESLAELAAEIDVPADGLRETVERFNGFARSGVDEDFHRGESAYDQYYSDPTVKPNPSLHSIDKGPFYAVRIVPGDLGTKGGLVTDEHARVLRPDGTVIEGLYAAGNVSAAVMGHTYAGPGATIGPALVFGYLAAEDIAKRFGAEASQIVRGSEAENLARTRSAETGAEASQIVRGSEAEDDNLRSLGDPTSGAASDEQPKTEVGLDDSNENPDVTHTAPGAF
jgi:3-oxosteroid 1-dehydrogenase